jgi:hypothetical protein
MKRAILVLMVLTLALTGPAVAAEPKVPKLVCFQYNAGWALNDVVHLTFKLMGTATTSAGKVKMYAVNGEHHWDAGSFPVTGTAHLNGSVLHWNATGTVYYGNELITFVEEWTWDVTTTNPAAGHWRRIMDAVQADVADSLTLVDCTGSAFPYDAYGK